MSGSAEEPPVTMEAGPPEEVIDVKESCEQSKTQLESVKDIMLKNKQSLKKKEEELQEYAKKLSKFKTRKASRPNKDDAISSNESTPKSKSDTTSIAESSESVVDDISQAKTPKAKSSLLQKKLAEDRKIFEKRSKEITQSKRAVEEKVEALRQQLEEKYVAPVSVVSPVLVTTQANQHSLQSSQDKISELNNKIIELEAVIIDLQDNLKEKDSVIDAKTKAITLMSADLSRKGKTTLDTLEDTKDEMRSMQENFVLIESSLRNKNDNLLKQLEEKNEQMLKLEDTVDSLTNKLQAQKEAEVISADFSKSTMDTLVDTKDAMKAMQENFILVETSLKSKNEYLLKQLEERELKLAEAEAKILHLESGLGIEKQPDVDNLIYKLEKLEQMNHNLQDEKYELQKSIAELQDRFISSESSIEDKVAMEKEDKVNELENLKEELRKSNEILELDRNQFLQQISDLNERNEAMKLEVSNLEKQVEELRIENGELSKKLTVNEGDISKDNDKVKKLTKELEELNKSMIKLKAQHKNKLKNVQKQLENFKKVSDANAELVKLGNQVALLEEEKGNLQLSLVDFDELKASAGDWQKRILDLEGKVSAQAKEIQAHVEAIAILENQKLDLMQELHSLKQEISSLEAENAESENLRVRAEMKLVDLEEELESIHKARSEGATDGERLELQRQLETLAQEKEHLSEKLSKLEEVGKSSSEVGSSESFVKTGSNVDSTESFEALATNDADKAELLRKIDGLTRENGALLEKLTRFEEKGSSDTGSTESFERIPEHGLADAEVSGRLDNLTRENYELVVKLTKLEERLVTFEEAEARVQQLAQENERLLDELARLREVEVAGGPRVERSLSPTAEGEQVESEQEQIVNKIEALAAQNETLTASLQELERQNDELEKEKQALSDKLLVEPELLQEQAAQAAQAVQTEEMEAAEQVVQLEQEQQVEQQERLEQTFSESAALARLEAEIERCNQLIAEQNNVIEEMRLKMADKEEELARKSELIASGAEACKLENDSLRRELEESASSIAEWRYKCTEVEAKIDAVEQAKRHIEEGLEALQQEKRSLLEQSEQKEALIASLREELDQTVSRFENKLKEQSELVAARDQLVQQLRDSLANTEDELQAKYMDVENYTMKMALLQNEVDKLQIQLDQREASIASSVEELQALKHNSSVLTEELLSTRQQLSNLHELLDKSKSPEEYQQVLDQLKMKEMQLVELERHLAEERIEMNELKSRSEEFDRENRELRESLQEEKNKIEEILEAKREQNQMLGELAKVKHRLDNQLQELQAAYEQSSRNASEAMRELREAYKQLEQLKIKHTEDMEMLNQRLENLLEELEAKMQETASLQNELEEKNKQLENSVPQEAKATLEDRLAELQNKLTEAEDRAQQQLEKMKKYAAIAKKKSTQCEELEAKLAKLEEKLADEAAKTEATSSLMQELENRDRQKDNRITELEEEMRLLLKDRDEALRDAEVVKQRFAFAIEKLTVLQDEVRELDEAKDRARELGVRMEVMENDYVENLAFINSLRTENGFLLSKQAQINERLENVEKESEERRIQLEIIENREKEKEKECATKAHTLEDKAQERELNIENADNSIGNLVKIQENLWLDTTSSNNVTNAASADTLLPKSYDELKAAHEELKAQQEVALRDSKELTERAARLEEANATMLERLDMAERQLSEAKELALAHENLGVQYSQLLDQFERQKAELVSAHSRLEETLLSSEKKEAELLQRIEQLDQMCASTVGQSGALLQDIEVQSTAETPSRPKRQLNDSPPLFDASVFGAPTSRDSETEKEMQVIKLREEINILKEDLKMSRLAKEEVETRLNGHMEFLNEEMQTLKAVLVKRDEEIFALQTELSALKEQLLAVEELERKKLVEKEVDLERETESETKTKEMNDKLVELSSELEKTRSENEELQAMQTVYKLRLSELENEAKTSSDSAVIAELENRISRMLSERDILQLQMNEATRAFEDLRESQSTVKSLQAQLQIITQEKEQLVEKLNGLEALKVPTEMSVEVQVEAAATEEPSKTLTTESMWENDDDPWGFDDKTIPQIVEPHVDIPVVPSAEIQLKLKLEELEERLAIAEDEKAKLLEESKLAQIKNVKYVKKLKEYKLQLDNMRQQLQSQKSLDSFGELDSAIEEELKGQIAGLEKTLGELREEKKKLTAEKENQARRIEVLTAATERFTEAKEKQDTELHIWQMRYKELEQQLQKLDFGPETREASSSPARNVEGWTEKPDNQLELKELRDNVEALAAENEELQQLLEEQRSSRQPPVNEARLQELESKLFEVQSSNDKLKLDYESLRKQYEQTLMDADAETRNIRQSHELLKMEWAEREAAATRTIDELNEKLEATLTEKALIEATLTESLTEITQLKAQLEAARTEKAQIEATLAERLAEVTHLKAQLEATLTEKEQIETTLTERLAEVTQLKAQLEAESVKREEQQARSNVVEISSAARTKEEDLPMFTFGSDDNEQQLRALRIQLEEKNLEIQQLQESLNDNALTHTVQHLQDSINILYNEKDSLEKELREKDAHIASLTQLVMDKEREKEEEGERVRYERSVSEQEEVIKLQNELHERELQLNQLRDALAENELRLKVTLEEAATDCENRESAERLRSELYKKQEELEALKFTVSDLQSEIAALRGLERLADEDRATIEKLTSEKEETRREAQESLHIMLQEKESEMNRLKQELESEKQNLIESLGMRENDIQNLRIQIEQRALHSDTLLEEKTELLGKLENELSDRDRRLAELSITKDTEIHNLHVQLSEKTARIEELKTLSEEEERQLAEVRKLLEVKEQQINGLSQQLDEKSKEFELIQRALQRHMPSEFSTEQHQQAQEELSGPARTFDSSDSSAAKELDVALYMLHQRDVRCEELTLELMQLLEERDTLQLRLSNAIRINEELRKYTTTSTSPKKLSSDQSGTSETEHLLGDPSPSKSEGSVEITKEANNLAIEEDNKALAQKLSQLKSVSHGKDVRLRDERETRHTQQMSLLVHKDVLSSLPPEAAARLVDANYTVSRDVQSQSSVLMNWLWGKSTPKVVHM